MPKMQSLACLVKRRDVERFHAEMVQADANPRDIDQRIRRANLVEVHAGDRHPVDARLGVGQTPEGTGREGQRPHGEIAGAGEDRQDLAQGPTVVSVVVRVVVIVRVGVGQVDIVRTRDGLPPAAAL